LPLLVTISFNAVTDLVLEVIISLAWRSGQTFAEFVRNFVELGNTVLAATTGQLHKSSA
jgi:hypothetical protein